MLSRSSAAASLRVSSVCLKSVKGNAITGKRFSSNAKGEEAGFLNADSSKAVTKFYHLSSLVLIGLTPLALLNPTGSPYVSFPVDMALGVLFPLHSHIALNYVISDYVPKASRSLVRAGLLGATIVAAAGILKLNIMGPGLTDVIKSLWRKPKAVETSK